MQARPVVLVESLDNGRGKDEAGTITAIAVYSGEAPLSVVTRRIFEGEERFRFPTEVTEGMTKTRVVYCYTLKQWHELLETCTMPHVQAGLKQIMIPLLIYFRENFPGKFGSIDYDNSFEPGQYAEIIKLK